MSKPENTLDKKGKIPPIVYVMIPVSLYFFYQAYSLLSISNYFTGGFFLVVGIILAISTYTVYKEHKGGAS